MVSDIMAHVSATKHLTGEHALVMRRAVYKDGKRVPVTYKVLGKDGAVLAEGTMNYG